jgi:hypothetical protein
VKAFTHFFQIATGSSEPEYIGSRPATPRESLKYPEKYHPCFSTTAGCNEPVMGVKRKPVSVPFSASDSDPLHRLLSSCGKLQTCAPEVMHTKQPLNWRNHHFQIITQKAPFVNQKLLICNSLLIVNITLDACNVHLR